jgi:uncharacterized membrane protein
MDGEPVAYAPAWVVVLRIPGFMLLVLTAIGVGLRWDPVLTRTPRKRNGALGSMLTLVFAMASYGQLKMLHTLAVGDSRMVWTVWDCTVGGLLLVGMGNYLAKSASNGFWAYRSPWTARSEKVYRQTQRVAGWFLVLGGVMAIVGAPLLLNLPHEILAVSGVGYLLLDWLVAFAVSYFFYRLEATRKESI